MKKQQTKKQQKSQKNDTIKTIVIAAIAFIIFLLLAFSEDIVNLYYKNKIAMLENSNIEIIEGYPNAPKLSAGMIPVKCVDTYWQITSEKEWNYSYENGEPAYMMLNDGYYRSEIEVGVKEDQLAENNIGAQIQENQVGSIYMWIPRFEINDETSAIKYIQNVGEAEDGYTIPDIFMYKQAKEIAPDFLLTGVWVAIDTDANYATTINNMQGEDNTYGFIANTVGVGVPDDPTYQTTIEKYVANVVPPINDITNTNRIILKIINTNNIDAIKAKSTLNTTTIEVTINVTYTKNGIAKIEDANGNILSENSTTAVYTNIPCNGTYYYKITDKLGNVKKIKQQIDITTTITYDVNGGTTTVENTTAGYGDTIEMPIPERIYTVSYVTNNSETLEDSIVSYTFDGWYSDETDEKREYTTMPAHNETLYAGWTETSITLPTPKAESKAYTFEGWYSDSELTTKVGDGGATYTPRKNITLYANWKTQTDYYGALVTNYSAGGVSSWRVFHIDDENIYLITDDYIPNANLPTDTSGTTELNKSETYQAYWNTTVLEHYSGSAWITSNTNTKAQKWLNQYLTAYPSSTKDNIKATAYMMDTDSWSEFANSEYAEYALGGSTIELYCASYKVTHPDKYIECKVNSTGYLLRWTSGDDTTWVNSLSNVTSNEFNNIYGVSDTTRANGCWFASPSSEGSDGLFFCKTSGALSYSLVTSYFHRRGFRPIVCLKSNVELVSNGDGTYKIQ